MDTPAPITTLEAARILRVSETRVRQLSATGELPAKRTSGGIRLFDRVAVERLAQERGK